jgi:hypothetical protein
MIVRAKMIQISLDFQVKPGLIAFTSLDYPISKLTVMEGMKLSNCACPIDSPFDSSAALFK